MRQRLLDVKRHPFLGNWVTWVCCKESLDDDDDDVDVP